MILSILDTDLYKFSVSWAYMKLYPEALGEFTFTDRSKEVYNEKFLEELSLEINKLYSLRLKEEEFKWVINKIKYIPECYWEWLRGFRFNPKLINFSLDSEGHLQISVVDKMYKVTLYEVPILALVSELRNRIVGYKADTETMLRLLDDKINFANQNQLYFSEFGTRRRYSSYIHEEIVRKLKDKCSVYCTGTSNVYFAYKYNMTPQGTFPHEWIMFHAGVGGYKKANQRALEAWQSVYHGNLGIALMDTFTTKVFLSEFSMELALLFRGVRQDSGDEIKIGNMVIDRYLELGIDPTTKTIVFSNALDFKKYAKIKRYFNGQINVRAGIGTNLTCDTGLTDYKPANIVMKLTKTKMTPREEWQNTLKISDDFGKHLGNEEEYKIACHQLGIKE